MQSTRANIDKTNLKTCKEWLQTVLHAEQCCLLYTSKQRQTEDRCNESAHEQAQTMHICLKIFILYTKYNVPQNLIILHIKVTRQKKLQQFDKLVQRVTASLVALPDPWLEPTCLLNLFISKNYKLHLACLPKKARASYQKTQCNSLQLYLLQFRHICQWHSYYWCFIKAVISYMCMCVVYLHQPHNILLS